jgi:ABC-type amino acid transport system permease subunit
MQQLHCAAVAELTAMLKTIRASNMSTTEVLVLVCILFLSIAFLVRLLLALVLS